VRDEFDGPAGAESAEAETVEEEEEADSGFEEETDDFSVTATEVSTDDLIAVEVPVDPVDSRLSLNDILTPPQDDEELRQRVELLGRLVARLVERVKLPENEIIEVLIRSGIEF